MKIIIFVKSQIFIWDIKTFQLVKLLEGLVFLK